jgi:CspA family cold shock protein
VLDSGTRSGVAGAICFSRFAAIFFEDLMAEGTIKRLTDKGFGFINTGKTKDLFFHSSDLNGVTFEQLREGQRVSYTEGVGPKGPRAEKVTPI